MTDRVLFVCQANLCRSPMAEYIARQLLAGSSVTVASAGTRALAGRSMHPYAAEVTLDRGADPGGFRSRQLLAEHLAEASLVLTATREQRSVCVALAPVALHRTFTLRQFGRLAEAAAVPAGRSGWDSLRVAVEAAALARGRLQPAPPGADDLGDPVTGTPDDFRHCAAQIERSMTPIVALIAAAG